MTTSVGCLDVTHSLYPAVCRLRGCGDIHGRLYGRGHATKRTDPSEVKLAVCNTESRNIPMQAKLAVPMVASLRQAYKGMVANSNPHTAGKHGLWSHLVTTLGWVAMASVALGNWRVAGKCHTW